MITTISNILDGEQPDFGNSLWLGAEMKNCCLYAPKEITALMGLRFPKALLNGGAFVFLVLKQQKWNG